jgi:hypothetical protein
MLPQVWVDYFRNSIVCNLSPGLRVGGFLDARTTGWGKFLHQFTRASVPFWLVWGTTYPAKDMVDQSLSWYFPDYDTVEKAQMAYITRSNTLTLKPSDDSDSDYGDDCGDVSCPNEALSDPQQHPKEYRALIVHENSGQRPRETWEEFFARKDAVRQRRMQTESADQRQSREDREKNARTSGPNKGATFFVWRRDKELPSFYRRTYVTRYDGMQKYKECSVFQRFYWASTNEWDLVPHLPRCPPGSTLPPANTYDSDDDDDDCDDDGEPIFPAEGPSLQKTPEAKIGDVMMGSVRAAVGVGRVPVREEYKFTFWPVTKYLRFRHGFLADLEESWHPQLHTSEANLKLKKEEVERATKDLLYGSVSTSLTPEMQTSVVDFRNVVVRSDVEYEVLPRTWDLSPLQPSILVCDQRRISLQRIECKLFSHKDLYILRPPARSKDPSPWFIATTNATTVLLVYRSPWTTMYEIASGLLELGVGFRTVVEVRESDLSTPIVVRPRGRVHGLGERPIDFEPTLEDFQAYEQARDEVLRSEQGRALRLLGGLVGRIASEVVPDIKVLDGPSLANVEVVGVHGSSVFVDDKADDLKVDIVCGIYLVPLHETKKTEHSQPSWWPREITWRLGGLFNDQWLPDAEQYYQARKAQWSKGVYELLKATDWKRKLKLRVSTTRKIEETSNKWAASFIGRDRRVC